MYYNVLKHICQEIKINFNFHLIIIYHDLNDILLSFYYNTYIDKLQRNRLLARILSCITLRSREEIIYNGQ